MDIAILNTTNYFSHKGLDFIKQINRKVIHDCVTAYTEMENRKIV